MVSEDSPSKHNTHADEVEEEEEEEEDFYTKMMQKIKEDAINEQNQL